MTIKPTLDQRSRLYYDQWKYVVHFRMESFFKARKLDHGHLGHYKTPLWQSRDGGNHDVILRNLHAWISFMQAAPVPFKQVCSYHWGYVYTNDKQFVDDICHLPYLQHVKVKEACVCQPPDVILLSNPQHRLRTYMRDLTPNPSSIPALCDYVFSQPWRVGPGFRNMLNPDLKYHYIRRYHFVDHDDTRETMFLNIIVPGIVGRTLPIQAK
jgi:hypothetical protein